jgi:hypothetical protein
VDRALQVLAKPRLCGVKEKRMRKDPMEMPRKLRIFFEERCRRNDQRCEDLSASVSGGIQETKEILFRTMEKLITRKYGISYKR